MGFSKQQVVEEILRKREESGMQTGDLHGGIRSMPAQIGGDNIFTSQDTLLDKMNILGNLTTKLDDWAQGIGTYENDNPILKSLGNIPGSLIKNATAILRGATNPYDLLVGLGKLVGTKDGRDMLGHMYGTKEGREQRLTEDPVGVISDVASVVMGGAGIVAKAGGLAKAGGTVSKLASTAGKVAGIADDVSMLGINKAMNSVNTFAKGDGLINKAVNVATAGTRPIETAGAIAKGVGKVANPVITYGVNQITGLSPETRKFAVDNPDLLKKFQNGEITVNDLVKRVESKFDFMNNTKSEIGKGYETIKEQPINLDTSELIDKINTQLGKNNGVSIKIKNGKLQLDIAHNTFNTEQIKAIKNAFQSVKDLNSIKNKKGSDILNSRKRIDDNANYKDTSNLSSIDKDAQKIIKGMRRGIDELAGENLEGLKDIDSRYSALLNEIKELKKDWFNSDGSLKDNAHSRMRNLLSNANVSRLERIEKQLPGITEDVKALQAIQDITRAMENKVGTYARGGLASGGMIMSILSGNPATAVLATLGFFATNPKTVISVLKSYGLLKRRSKDKLNKIIENGKISKELESDIKIEVKNKPKVIEKIIKNMTEKELQTTIARQPSLFEGFNEAAPAIVAKQSKRTMNENTFSSKITVDTSNILTQKETTNLLNSVRTTQTNKIPIPILQKLNYNKNALSDVDREFYLKQIKDPYIENRINKLGEHIIKLDKRGAFIRKSYYEGGKKKYFAPHLGPDLENIHTTYINKLKKQKGII